MNNLNLIPLLPELLLAVTGMLFLLTGVSRKKDSSSLVSWLSVFSYLAALGLLVNIGWHGTITLNGMFILDSFAGMMKIMILLGLVAAVVLSVKYLEEEGIARFEYPMLVTFAGIGMMLMVSANNLLSLYMALELQSLSLYVLAAFRRNSPVSSEAGVKYFTLGAISSGMVLFGISLIYGFTGTLDYGALTSSLSGMEVVPLGITFGLVFLLAGIAFKISAVPFHMWTPDVYQGAPTSVTALFAMAPKVAAMGMLMRLIFEPFSALTVQWEQIIYFLALASMIVGAFAAIMQENIKRLLAYSSIGNMGYALIGLVAATPAGAGSVILYLFIYLVMTAGAFGVILCMRRGGRSVEGINDLAGLSQTNPALAYTMAILMFSMSGIPPMAGFFGKLLVFQSAINTGHYVLAVIGVLTSVVAAYYYLRIVKVMFFDAAAGAFDGKIPFSRRAVLFVSILFVLGFALKPSVIVDASQAAAAALFAG